MDCESHLSHNAISAGHGETVSLVRYNAGGLVSVVQGRSV